MRLCDSTIRGPREVSLTSVCPGPLRSPTASRKSVTNRVTSRSVSAEQPLGCECPISTKPGPPISLSVTATTTCRPSKVRVSTLISGPSRNSSMRNSSKDSAPDRSLAAQLPVVEGSEPFGDDVHVGSVADAEHPQAARFADRLDDDREPVRLNELPNVLRGTADRGGHRADALRGQVPAHPPLVQQQFHGGDGLAAEAERLVDPRRRQQPELEQRHGRLERVRLVQRPDQRQEPVDVAVVEQQRLIDVGPVAAVVLVRELGVNHVQAELPGLAHML